METSFQKIIAAIVGVMIMFIIPVYIAFEKADDVSYSLAVKLTQNFVDNARNKGYISPDMYSDFVSGLYATNNAYDVNIEHVKKRYDPVIYIYEKVNGEKGRLLHVLDYAKYAEDYENNEITIDVGIYNLINSNIEVVSPSITLKDGSYVLDKDNHEITDVKKLYEDYIDQYKAQNRIILDSGEVYADVGKYTGSSFDDDIYIPSIIDDTFKGKIEIINKQGTESNTLPYETYKNEYFNSKAEGGDGVFSGPTYGNEDIVYVPALMRIKGVDVSAEESEKMYYERINQYRTEEQGDGRLVFDAGEIYADKEVIKTKENSSFDAKLDKEASISVETGSFEIKEESKVVGYESDLDDYNKYIGEYKTNGKIVFEGEIYTDSNSTIKDLKGAIWKEGTELSEEDAITLYDNKLSQYIDENRIVIDEGEIYVTGTEAVGYDKLTDKISQIDVDGTIKVNDATGWEPETLDFDKYINEYRQNGEIEYIKDGTYSAKRNKGYLKTSTGFEFNFSANEDKMLDSSETININVIYENANISFGINPVLTVKNKENGEELYSKEISSIAEIKKIVDNRSVSLDESEIMYNGDVKIGTYEYSSGIESEYEIEISVPSCIWLEEKLPSPIEILDQEEIKKKIDEYIENGNISYDAEYQKEYLLFQRESFEIMENDETIFTFYHDLNEKDYERYLLNATYDKNGDVSEVTVDSITLRDKLEVKYTEINIDGRDSITITDENRNLIEDLIEDYYNTGRIVIKPSTIWTQDEINIQDPKLTIYEKDTENIIYEFDGKKETKHEKYDQYVNEYRADKRVTIIPIREYTKDDLNITPSKIVIDVLDEKEPKTLTFYDTDSVYEDYLKQFDETGKIQIAKPSVYTIDEFEVQDPHIQIKQSGNVIIDIYEKENEKLYADYEEQYLYNKKITLKYDINDISCERAKITINVLEKVDSLNTTKDIIVIEDNHESYNTYLSEYESTGIITFEGALVYTADKLDVKEPSVTIRDPDTGSIIVKYEGDYSKFTREERYKIYESHVKEYTDNNQIVTDKKVTYKDGENYAFEKAHIVNEEVITDKQIVTKLFKDTGVSKTEFLRQCLLGNGDMYNSLIYMNENSYVMNEGDQINVTVKNKSRTIASTFYSLLTANVGTDEIAKIYVNYGGTVKNSGDTILTSAEGIVTSETGRLFKYRGQAEEVILSPGIYDIECFGASGGYPESADVNNVGRGAYAKARFNITEETTLYVYVGSKGTEYSETNQSNGGFNGGGNSYSGYGGGGATDVRLLKRESQDTASLLTRIIVAAGGGGNSKELEGYGGSGGDLSSGIDGKTTTPLLPVAYTYRKLNGLTETNSGIGLGANINNINAGYLDYMDHGEKNPVYRNVPENEQGTFGRGGTVDFDGAGAGGGGYFGGSAAHDTNAGGGGGLSYIYNGQKTEKDGVYYPLISEVLLQYDYKVLEEIKPYIDGGKWIGIENMGSADIDVRDGESEMPTRLTYTGSETMNGNTGNGYAIIKKVE